MKSMPLARHQSMTSGPQLWLSPPDQDPRIRPVHPDRADEAAQMREDFCAARPLRRTPDRSDEPVFFKIVVVSV